MKKKPKLSRIRKSLLTNHICVICNEYVKFSDAHVFDKEFIHNTIKSNEIKFKSKDDVACIFCAMLPYVLDEEYLQP